MAAKLLEHILENSNGKQRRAALVGLLLLGLLVVLGGIFRPQATSHKGALALADGVLNVVLLDPLFERFDSPGTPAYLNLLLAREFARKSGRTVNLIKTDNRKRAVQQLRSGDVHLIVSNNIETSVYPFPGIKSISLSEVGLLLVGVQGPSPAPDGLAELSNKSIAVDENSGAAKIMLAHQDDWPSIQLEQTRDRTTPELMDMVLSTEVQYAVIASNEFLMFQHFFPDLIAKYEFEGIFTTGWLVASRDAVFSSEIEQFVRDVKSSGRMQALAELNQGHLWNFNYADAVLFLDRVRTLLPQYQQAFEQAGEAYDLDWRLLAAIAHQESHWDPLATSPTGVRGMMMLTRSTAAEMGVTDRLSASQSIDGGARYFKRQHDLLTDEIHEPHRSWIALASYNLGRAHILRAQRLASDAGSDPNDWQQLRYYIRSLERTDSLLTSTRLDRSNSGDATGNASDDTSTVKRLQPLNGRGLEALKYVDNVRRYYDMLNWMGKQQNQKIEDSLAGVDG